MITKPPIDADALAAAYEARGKKLPALKRPAGRPRQYASDQDRRDAYRARKGLKRVSVDVPADKEQAVRDFAAELRNGADGDAA
jgi:hypothetical protein